MSRAILFAVTILAALSSSFSFTAPRPALSTSSVVVVFSEPEKKTNPSGVERGVSVDQDGKSNVWAIEPKMELDDKSNEEKTTGLIIGGAAFAAFAVGAGFLLTHLPDPDQF
mmetsp:Transcript_22267/g.32872  ORF Transcript_22267/g.32872 Transcript_22267/m.32872 type:complete len:112 (+) Transcript_22267:83-418(+)